MFPPSHCRKRKEECRTCIPFAVHPDIPLVRLRSLLRDRQADSATRSAMFRSWAPVEAFKNQLTVFTVDYGTLVMHCNHDSVILLLGRKNYWRIAAGVLCGVHNEFCKGHRK